MLQVHEILWVLDLNRRGCFFFWGGLRRWMLVDWWQKTTVKAVFFFVNAKVLPPQHVSVVKKNVLRLFFVPWIDIDVVVFVVDFLFWSSDQMTPNKKLGNRFNLNEVYHHFPSLDFILPISNHPKLNSEIPWLLRPRWVMGEMPTQRLQSLKANRVGRTQGIFGTL